MKQAGTIGLVSYKPLGSPHIEKTAQAKDPGKWQLGRVLSETDLWQIYVPCTKARLATNLSIAAQYGTLRR